MGVGAPTLDLLTVRVSFGSVVHYEKQVAARLAPPIGDQRVVPTALLVDVDDVVSAFAFSFHVMPLPAAQVPHKAGDCAEIGALESGPLPATTLHK